MGQGCTLISYYDMHGSTGQGSHQNSRQLAPALLGLSSDPSSPKPPDGCAWLVTRSCGSRVTAPAAAAAGAPQQLQPQAMGRLQHHCSSPHSRRVFRCDQWKSCWTGRADMLIIVRCARRCVRGGGEEGGWTERAATWITDWCARR